VYGYNQKDHENDQEFMAVHLLHFLAWISTFLSFWFFWHLLQVISYSTTATQQHTVGIDLEMLL
jgi:hypothetical protein